MVFISLRDYQLTIKIFNTFNKYFETIPAITDNLKNEAYKLRYLVYCVENTFEKADHYPDGMEFDKHDQQSIQYLILHRKSGDFVATVRLILPDTNNPDYLLPLEQHCEIDHIPLLQQIDRKHLAEVSRFCISKSFKRRRIEADNSRQNLTDPKINSTRDEKKTFPFITIALIACIIKASHENNIEHWFAVMDTSLIRFLSKIGINFIKIGPMVDYHGLRWPTAIKITDLLDSVAEKNIGIWEFLTSKGGLLETPTSITTKSVDTET